MGTITQGSFARVKQSVEQMKVRDGFPADAKMHDRYERALAARLPTAAI